MPLQRTAGAESGRGIPNAVATQLRRALQSLPTEKELQDTAMVELNLVYNKPYTVATSLTVAPMSSL